MAVRPVLAATLAMMATSLPSLSQAQSTQFDLNCAGTWTAMDQSAMPWRAHFAIDLVRGLYCQDGCKAPSPINKIGSEKLVLTYVVTQSGSVARTTVNRITGNLLGQIISLQPRQSITIEAACKRGAYSGMPTTLY